MQHARAQLTATRRLAPVLSPVNKITFSREQDNILPREHDMEHP